MEDQAPQDSVAMDLDETNFLLLSPPKSKKPEEEPLNIISLQDAPDQGKVKPETSSPFVSTYPTVYPPDWSLSPANYYKQPS